MSDWRHIDERVSAWLDGEVGPEEAAALEARLQSDPEFAREVEAFQEAGRALQRTAYDWEEGVDWTRFQEGVFARLPATSAPRPAGVRRLWDRFSDWANAHRPALAGAVAALLLVVGGSAAWLLDGSGEPLVPTFRGAEVTIEDLSLENASAVVYRTRQDVTVIWLTEEQGA